MHVINLEASVKPVKETFSTLTEVVTRGISDMSVISNMSVSSDTGKSNKVGLVFDKRMCAHESTVGGMQVVGNLDICMYI